MRVVICPDKFAGTISAVDAAGAVVAGWASVAPADTLLALPLSDGGPGFVDVLAVALDGATRRSVQTTDPLGRPVTGDVLLHGTTAYLESAQACGLHLLAEPERDPKRTTTFGLGTLVLSAVESGAQTVVVGLGGSATNDGGAGFLAAIGVTPLDAAGRFVGYGGAAVADCVAIDGGPRVRDAVLVAATDVDSPLTGLHGASAVFGPQKGASREDVFMLDGALSRFSQVLQDTLPGCPPDLGSEQRGIESVDGPMAAGAIADRFSMARPSLSEHLRVLREAGLVTSRVAGQQRIYALDRRPLAELDTWLERFRPLPVPRGGPASRLDALDTELRRGRRARRTSDPEGDRDDRSTG